VGALKAVKKIPQRTCIGCRKVGEKKDFIRIVRQDENNISLDFNGKKPGRGAYICKNVDCFELMKKHKSLGRALKAEIPSEIYDLLKQELINNKSE
jgi:predicted RNA-binding protein YlxR (DUF448 family)